MPGSAPVQTPRSARLERQELVSRELAVILDRHRVTRAQLAAAAGVPEQRARDWADPEEDRHLAIADVLPQDPRVRVELAQLVAGDGFQVVLSTPATPETLRDVLEVLGGTIAACAASEASGFVSPANAITDLAAIRALIAKLQGLEQHRLEAIKHRGLRVAGASR
jgi:hypothetical protein